MNLYDQGNYDEAILLMRDALALRRALHDGPHPELAEHLNDLGFLLGEAGQLQCQLRRMWGRLLHGFY